MLSYVLNHNIISKSKRSKIIFQIVSFSKSLTQTNDGTVSNRKLFQQIVPEPGVLNLLDKLDLGYFRRKFRAKPVIEEHEVEVPFPFSKGPKGAQILSHVDSITDIPAIDDQVPEVAIIGRSNVGKSTLLNALIGFQSHSIQAKVSNTPGETRKLQIYSIGVKNNLICFLNI